MIDVGVPTYRCDLDILRRIIALRCEWPRVTVHFWLIVDNPQSPNVDAVRSLETARSENGEIPNYCVHVHVHKGNFGASVARNTALDYSNADWMLLLDDDVTVDSELLNAYVGAILRHPQARILVGNT